MKVQEYSCDIQPGDVIGFTKHTWLSWAIELGTLSWPGHGISHVGIVADHPQNSGLLLYESLAHAHKPCVIQKAIVTGVQASWLPDALTREGVIRIYRLTHPLTPLERNVLSVFCRRSVGIKYDSFGAFGARDLMCGWLRRFLFTREDLNRVFCSEFVAEAHRFLKRFPTRNVSAWSPNRLMRTEVKAGIVHPPITVQYV